MTAEGVVDLTTKIVVLGTAVIGLLTVAWKARAGERIIKGIDLGILEPFLLMAGFAAFMLLFPAIFAATAWLNRSAVGANDSQATPVLRSDSIAQAWGLRDDPLYAMVAAASQSNSTRIKDELLVVAARTSLNRRQPRVAWLAARELYRNATRDSVLLEVVVGFIGINAYSDAAGVVPDFYSNGDRDIAAAQITHSAAKFAMRQRRDTIVQSVQPLP